MILSESDQQLLLELLMAAQLYVRAKQIPNNPFVRSMGRDNTEVEAFELMNDCVQRAAHLLPLITEIVAKATAEEMNEIESEEQRFDESSES